MATPTVLPALLPPCPLARDFATDASFHSTIDSSVRRQIMAAYTTLPFKGKPIVLPSGVCVAEDSWECALELELDGFLMRNASLADFNLEAWLKNRISMEGTVSQRLDFDALVANLDVYDRGPTSDLPTDVSLALANPVQEIEVYRSIPDLPDLDRCDEDDVSDEDN